MKKQTKKEIWYWMIMGTSILILLAFAYAGKGNQSKQEKKTVKKEAQQEAMVKSEQEPESKDQSSGSNKDQPQGGGQEPNYYREAKGGQIGQSYLLLDSAIQDYSKESWLLLFLKPRSYSKLPHYTGQLSGNKINISLSDTTDFDITSGQSSYQGKYTLSGKGVIKQVKVIRSSGSKMSFRLTLSKSSPFKVSKLLNPLRLVVQVKK